MFHALCNDETKDRHAEDGAAQKRTPGMERDSRGNAIPLKERTADDKEKAKRARTKKPK
jgi:hypothetical protein